MLLLDTNVWLELLLGQERAQEVRQLLEAQKARDCAITEFSLYSLGIVLTRLKKSEAFTDFLADTLEDSGVRLLRLDAAGLKRAVRVGQEFGLDFNDAYQYAAAEKHDLTLVSFDRDFDRTERGRKEPSELMRPGAP